jgi:hypothetical protein
MYDDAMCCPRVADGQSKDRDMLSTLSEKLHSGLLLASIAGLVLMALAHDPAIAAPPAPVRNKPAACASAAVDMLLRVQAGRSCSRPLSATRRTG